MCNRCSCGCNSNWQNSSRCGCMNTYNRCGCHNNWQATDDRAWMEAERMMREIEMRRCQENRCARQFVRCLNCNNWY